MATDTLGIRDYRADDADITLALFQRAVREVAARDYTPAQLEAWAGGIDRTLWAITLARQSTWLAMIDDTPAGFASLTDRGHLDMLFVSPDYQRRGVASALLSVVEQAAQRRGITRVTTEASLAGRPFFEARGFNVVTKQTMKRRGEVLKNFWMEKVLHGTAATA
ncbi:GNAT family N-acetyltransferase [Kushneria indalinina]|uniref:Putative acetyltransferase n=1 Tax=Kushneria indalinina DSM 14324 TaxID=1122140 RepID=A0A3D9DXR3_9GAMM|nr:GNAT family N-acetyltransferase [Kushneria indalinina]REC95568.1 putative acetyltransferase [Kushneria indalinina DSM 14324]